MALLRSEVRRGITICIIEHNLEIVVSISDRISFLDQGRLLADGEPEEILGNPELSSIYFGERNS
ncbi:ABC-type branched-subunit amino acid transport system ATPase component [Bradyrhizobium barranii subsp. barranii]